MFGNKKKNELKFETKNYVMKDYYSSNNLVVANLELVSNYTEIPTVETTNQRYIFEVVNEDGKERFREVFTGFIADKENCCCYFNLPYVVDIIPIKEVLPTICDEIPKLALLLALNEVNKKKKVKDEVCVIFKDEEEEKKFSKIASDINHKTKKKAKK